MESPPCTGTYTASQGSLRWYRRDRSPIFPPALFVAVSTDWGARAALLPVSIAGSRLYGVFCIYCHGRWGSRMDPPSMHCTCTPALYRRENFNSPARRPCYARLRPSWAELSAWPGGRTPAQTAFQRGCFSRRTPPRSSPGLIHAVKQTQAAAASTWFKHITCFHWAMEEAASSPSSASSMPGCIPCGPMIRGQEQCVPSGSSQSTPEPNGAPNTPIQTLSGSPSEPVWVGLFASAMSEFTASTQALLGHVRRTMPAQTPCKVTVPPKRPRVDPPAPPPFIPLGCSREAEVQAPEPMDMLESSAEDSRSEGECSDMEQEGDHLSPSMSAMVEDLISAVRDTLHIKDSPVADEQEEYYFHPAKGSGKTFPVRGDLTLSLTKAWGHPDKKFVPSKRLDQLYPFPATEVAKWSTAPQVDPPVARLAKHTTLPVADGASLRDPGDRRVEFFSKNAFEAGGSALRPAYASAWVAKAASQWALRLQRDVVAGVPAAELQPNLTLIIQATKFLCEASCDIGALVAQSTALIVAVRRSLWLKVWSADTASKRTLTNLPFLGLRLFGNKLDEIISVATGGKSILLPQNKPKRTTPRRDSGPRFQTFRRSPASKYQNQGYKPAAAQGKKPSNKPRSNWRGRQQSAPSTSSKQSSA